MTQELLLPDWSAKDDDLVTIRGVVADAKYFKEEGYIVVKLRLADGSTRSACLHRSNFTFHGRDHSDVPADERDAEMERTANLFRRSGDNGRKITVRMYRHQAELQGR
jgi:hypothetical protein